MVGAPGAPGICPMPWGIACIWPMPCLVRVRVRVRVRLEKMRPVWYGFVVRVKIPRALSGNLQGGG